MVARSPNGEDTDTTVVLRSGEVPESRTESALDRVRARAGGLQWIVSQRVG